MTDLHDVSTMGGSLSRLWYRWKYYILTTLLGLGALIGLAFLAEKYVLESADIPESTFVISGSKLMYHGNQSKFEERYLDKFPELPPLTASSPLIDEIEIKWVRLYGPNFTAQLSDYAPNLRVLHLDNVTVEDHFQPLHLPVLTEFYLNQGLEPEERDAPEYSLANGATPWLLSTLFFVNDSSKDFPTKVKKAYTTPINVTIFLKGSVAYQLNPGFNEVRLDISNCTEILTKLPKTYKIVTLGRCRDLTPTSINSEITLLNFYIVYVNTELLGSILRNLKKLEEFYAEIPDGPVDISLKDLSPTLRVLSVSSMRVIPGNKGYPNIKEFYFGSENQYGWIENRVTTLNESLFLNFGKIFPGVEKVGLFDLKDAQRYEFLRSVLLTPSVKWMIAENFVRAKNDTTKSDLAYDFIEERLGLLGLAVDEGDFLIETLSSGVQTGRPITKMEKLWYRYTYLGWCPIDSWPKYLYVQGIIENGGLL